MKFACLVITRWNTTQFTTVHYNGVLIYLQQQLIQEPVMPDRVKRVFEIYKTSIDLFVVIMNVLIYQGSESEDVVCCAVIR